MISNCWANSFEIDGIWIASRWPASCNALSQWSKSRRIWSRRQIFFNNAGDDRRFVVAGQIYNVRSYAHALSVKLYSSLLWWKCCYALRKPSKSAKLKNNCQLWSPVQVFANLIVVLFLVSHSLLYHDMLDSFICSFLLMRLLIIVKYIFDIPFIINLCCILEQMFSILFYSIYNIFIFIIIFIGIKVGNRDWNSVSKQNFSLLIARSEKCCGAHFSNHTRNYHNCLARHSDWQSKTKCLHRQKPIKSQDNAWFTQNFDKVKNFLRFALKFKS